MKPIVVTGVSRGIGLATAEALLAQGGYRVWGTSTSGHAPIKHQHFSCHPLSLHDTQSIEEMVLHLKEEKITLHGLVNNAGQLVEQRGQVSFSMEMLRQSLDVNLLGTIHLTESLLPLLETQGHIINITSNWGSFSDPFFDAAHPHYKISKSALNMYTRLLSERLKDQMVKVSAFDPGWVKTQMGGEDALREIQDVGQEIVSLLLKEEMPSGQFWRNHQIREW